MVAIPGGAVGRRKGMGQLPEPFAKDRIDLGGIQRVGDPLHSAGRVARADAVVQRLERECRVATAGASATRAH